MHQLQGELEGLWQGRIEIDRDHGHIHDVAQLVAAENLLHRTNQLLAGTVAYHFQHHAQGAVRPGAADPLAVEHLGVARHPDLGKELRHHCPAVRMKGAVVAIHQAGLGKKVGTIPESSQHRPYPISRSQLRPQQGVALEAHAETATHDDDVLALLLQLGQRTVGGNGDAQVTHHQVAVASHDLNLEHRGRAHEIGCNQGIHRTGEGHHREVFPQDEGDPPHRRRQARAMGLVQVGQVLALQNAFEGRSHVSAHGHHGYESTIPLPVLTGPSSFSQSGLPDSATIAASISRRDACTCPTVGCAMRTDPGINPFASLDHWCARRTLPRRRHRSIQTT
ncbi:hypothetical protein D9M71_309920 [compost metagenome]